MRGFLQDCRKIEQLASQIYQRLASDAAYASEVRTTFHKLSNDERAHAHDIDLLMQGLAHEVDAVAKVSWEMVEAAVRRAVRMVETLDSGPLSEEAALRLAVEMEQQFVKVHVNNALHFHNPRLAALFEELGRSDQTHLDALRECLTWWHARRKPQP